jgi:hypothetical protein
MQVQYMYLCMVHNIFFYFKNKTVLVTFFFKSLVTLQNFAVHFLSNLFHWNIIAKATYL